MNLWSELKASITGDAVGQIAAATGEDVDAIRRGLIGGALPAVLVGASERYSGEAGAGRLLDEARAADPDGTLLDDFGAAVRPGGDPAHPVGQAFLGSIFGARSDAVADVVADHAGIRQSSASALLAVAAPLFLGFLSKRSRMGGLDAPTLAESLREIREQAPGVAPVGLTGALGIGRADERESRAAGLPIAAAGRPKWLPWIAAALAAVALFALIRTCRAKEEAPPAAPAFEPAPARPEAVPAQP